MSKLRLMIIQSLVILLLLVLLFYFFYGYLELKKTITDLQQFKPEIEQLTENSKSDIINISQNTVKNSLDLAVNKFDSITTETIHKKLDEFQNDLIAIQKQIEDEQKKLENLQTNTERVEKGLPELVDLDNLLDFYYPRLYSEKTYIYTTIETFETSHGTISFSQSDFELGYVPSDNKLAWIRIGKKKSTLNSELIKAWIEDSKEIKKKLGYKKIYNKTKPSDYGEYTEELLEKGDMYFKTYFQYQRVLETYGRHSLQYTFYVEIGSYSRKEKSKLEKYNRSLGS